MSEYNPSDYKVEEVKAHVAENPQDAKAVLEAEKSGENRVTLVEHLTELVESQPEAPVPAEPAPVEVAPEPTPVATNVETAKVFDKDYEVTADRGYRVKKD